MCLQARALVLSFDTTSPFGLRWHLAARTSGLAPKFLGDLSYPRGLVPRDKFGKGCVWFG